MRFIRIFLFFIFLVSVQSFSVFAFEGFDHSLWDSFLKEYVNENGDVDYRRVKENREILDDYLALLSTASLREVTHDWPREESLAFWLNAYNAAVIKAIVDHYPVKSIQEIPSVWSMTEVLHVGENAFSLNDIRATELLGVYHDEKIHLVLSCGAESCPKLKRKAFTGPEVEGMLFFTTREFVNNDECVDIVPGRKDIKISKIFKWYMNDFNLDFGSTKRHRDLSMSETSLLSFLAYYLEDITKIDAIEEDIKKIKYLPFNWGLNDWNNKTPVSK